MLMVIFGAGASHGSTSGRIVGGRRPPLAQELLGFPTIAARYPASRAVIDYLERIEGSTLEDGLADFAAIAENSPERMKQLVAFRFYLCHVIAEVTSGWLSQTNGRTYYLRLFNYLLEWQETSHEPIRLVTFNYDTLIEDALGSLFTNWHFNDLASYIAREDWTLMKLHGSITWSRVAGLDTGAALPNVDRAIAAADQLASNDLQFDITNALDVTPRDNRVFFPALAVPMANKTTFECPPLHIEALKSCFPDVRRVLICGWRAAESHMIEILRAIHPGYLLGVVSGSSEDVDDVHGRLDDVDAKGNHVLDEPNGMEGLATGLVENLRPLLAPWE